ncbi:hypothetical protein PM082_009668 [Marasmius tenuissimus]|nr:hypothetical protein PM082_009668 [Marasmius tenuissimus]
MDAIEFLKSSGGRMEIPGWTFSLGLVHHIKVSGSIFARMMSTGLEMGGNMHHKQSS